MESIQFIVLLLIIIALIVLYFKKSNDERYTDLLIIEEEGKCPNCSVVINEDNSDIDIKQASCDGIGSIKFKCKKCGYENMFVRNSNSNCGI